MKKLAIIVPILLLALIFVSCSTSVTFTGVRTMCVRSETKYKVSLSCETFNGTATYNIKTDEDHAKSIHYDINVEDGTLTVEIEDNKGEQLYKDVFTPGAEPHEYHYYGLTDYGKYKIKITADGFKGSYAFDWSEVYDY